MGNCVSKSSSSKEREIPDKGYEIHVVSHRNARLGLQVEKNPQGEMHIGVRGGLEHKKDRIVKVDGEQKEEEVNKIPKILDIINNEERGDDIPEQ